MRGKKRKNIATKVTVPVLNGAHSPCDVEGHSAAGLVAGHACTRALPASPCPFCSQM